jgi:simple sugar transport system ATP-binding protein
VKRATLTLRAGEVVGLAGVDGSGQKELFAALTGLAPLSQGSLRLCGQPAPTAPAERFELGLRLVPEDRLSQAVVPSKSLEWNALLGLQRLAAFRLGPWVNGAAQRELAGAAALRFRTKHASLAQPLSDLSGGNQQRFVAGRALGHQPRIILAFQPTRGLDIEGTAQIYQEIRRLCREEGATALVVSFDLDELLEHTDRIAVMCGGVLTEADSRDRSHIGRLMVGAS